MVIIKSIADSQVIDNLKSGKVGVLPTDTIYGVVAAAANQEAVQKLYILKSREKKPGTIIAASIEQLVELGLKRRYLKAVEEYWPGAVTIIVPTDNSALQYLDQGVGTVAVRVVDDSQLVKLLNETGALVTSSANQPGKKPADTTKEAEAYFGDEVDFYVDGGNLSGRKPSTLIRIIDDAIEVLREGAVKIEPNE